MPIENRNLEPGTKLIAKYKNEEYRAEVIAGEEGKVKYRLADGREFKSPSAAGTAITGKACNGWAFWSVEPGAVPEEPPEAGSTLTEAEAEQTYVPLEEEPMEPTAATFRRVPNQRGVEEGQVRLYCNSCQSSFTCPADQTVDTCPEGHYPGEASGA